MGDLKKLLDKGKTLQHEQHIPPLAGKLPSLWPWAILALSLILISVGIELFWPIHAHGSLPPCGQTTLKEVSCQKPPSMLPSSQTD